MTQALVNPHFYRLGKLVHGCHEKIIQTRILIVGVGGIGCEILKVLSKCPLGEVHILDMDTIELSNLNRQFLFKQQHKGLSKALVAKESVQKLNPHFNVKAHHMNIKDLPISFYKQFNFIVLALDNIEARNYVNKIGVRLNIPLIDAGTLAYTGNVTTIIPSLTKCYTCTPKVLSQKVYPVCTIRMRPEKPIHCIVWAKLLFEAIFGPENDDNDLKDLASLAQSKDQLSVMRKLFQEDIQNIKNAKSDTDSKLNEIFVKKIKTISSQQVSNHNTFKLIDSFNAHQKKQTLEYNISFFSQSFSRLMKVKLQYGMVNFEKDDDDIIHFIASAANMRMHCFNIDQQSFNEVKNMAGNIIPAIASTNSIVSSIQVIQMIKYLKHQRGKMKSYFIQNQSKKITPLNLQKPIEQCNVCGKGAKLVTIQCNFSKFTLKQLIQIIKKTAEELEEFSISQGSKQIYNSDQPKEILLIKTIFQIGESYELDLILTNQDTMKQICTIWLIHNEKLEQFVINGVQKLIPGIQIEKIVEEPHVVKQDDDPEFQMLDYENQSLEIQIIEVKKRVNPDSQDLEDNQHNKVRKIKKVE